MRFPLDLTKLPFRTQVLPLRSNLPGSESFPPPSKEIIPPVEVSPPSLILSSASKLKSASAVMSHSPGLSKVTVEVIVKSVLAEPRVSARFFNSNCLKEIVESLLTVILSSNFKVAEEAVRVPPLFV